MSCASSSSCARLLALSASTLCPFLTPLKACSYETGFYYDFVTSQTSVDESILPLILVQMRRLRSEALTFELMTMMPKNAQSYLLSKGLVLQAHLLEDVETNLIQLCKLGELHDICPDELVSTTKEIGEFALYELLVFEKEVPSLGLVPIVRISGLCMQDKAKLKAGLKQVDVAKRNDPVKLASFLDFALFENFDCFFLPKMERSIQVLESAWRKECQAFGFEFIRSSWQHHSVQPVYEHFMQKKVTLPFRFAEIVDSFLQNDSLGCDLFFDPCRKRSLRASVFCLEPSLNNEVISSLQFMKKLATILPVDVSFVEQTAKSKLLAYAYATDLRGRKWTLSEMKLVRRKEMLCIELSYLLSIERAFALLFERFGGLLPLWLAPEQVRIVCVSSSAKEWALIVQQRLESEQARTKLSFDVKDLPRAIYEAKKDCVPICCIVGQREMKNRTVNFRVCENNMQGESYEVSLDSFIATFKECCLTRTWNVI